MSFERKTLLRLSAAAITFGILSGISFLGFTPADKIRKALYETYSYAEWSQAFSPAGRKILSVSRRLGAVYSDVFRQKRNKSTPLPDTVPVKADPLVPKETADEDASPVQDTLQTDANTQPPAEAWRMPHPGEVSSPFGQRVHPVTGDVSHHWGVDIAASYGDGVAAVHSGTVRKVGFDDANGNYVVLSHGDGITSIYIHLAEVCVSAGQNVPKDSIIGTVGSTGISTGPHIHFEIKENGVSVDPAKYIQ